MALASKLCIAPPSPSTSSGSLGSAMLVSDKAIFSWKLLFVILNELPTKYTPPPWYAVFASKSQSLISGFDHVPHIPPPMVARLSLNVHLSKVNVALSSKAIAPP